MTVESVQGVGFDPRTIRRYVFDLFEPRRGGRIGYLFDWFIMGLIAANVVAITVETIDALATPLEVFFNTFEIFSVTVFSIEYIARVWSAVENPSYAAPISGRLRFAFRPLVLVDLAAVAPFYLGVVGVGADLRFLRALRLVRIFRLFKLARYTAAVQTFALVFRDRKEKLVIAVFANALVLLVASSLMYHVERAAGSRTFSSIPDAMWWGWPRSRACPAQSDTTAAFPKPWPARQQAPSWPSSALACLRCRHPSSLAGSWKPPTATCSHTIRVPTVAKRCDPQARPALSGLERFSRGAGA